MLLSNLFHTQAVLSVIFALKPWLTCPHITCSIPHCAVLPYPRGKGKGGWYTLYWIRTPHIKHCLFHLRKKKGGGGSSPPLSKTVAIRTFLSVGFPGWISSLDEETPHPQTWATSPNKKLPPMIFTKMVRCLFTRWHGQLLIFNTQSITATQTTHPRNNQTTWQIDQT